MIALVKFIHIGAVVLWAGGLAALPGFYLQLNDLRSRQRDGRLHGEDVLRLQRAVRMTYVSIVSPAAFIAVASGIVLIFQRDITAPWFSLKLALVVGLVVTHTLAGMTLVRLFEEDGHYPVWRYVAATSGALGLAAAIITLTLSKPLLSAMTLPLAMSEPGALKDVVQGLSPWHRP